MPIRVTIELIPNGDESRKSTLAAIEIENVRMYPDDGTADYAYTLSMDGKRTTGKIYKFYRPNGFLGLVSNVADDACVHNATNETPVLTNAQPAAPPAKRL